MMRRSTTESATYVNPASVAESVAGQTVRLEDDHLLDEDGRRVTPADPAVDHRADRLGRAAALQSWSDALIFVRDLLGQQRKQAALAKRGLPQRPTLEQSLEKLAGLQDWLMASVPHASQPSHAKVVAMTGKMLLLPADMGITAMMLWTLGMELVLAVAASLGVAMALIAVGSLAGRQLKEFSDRHQRGPVPDGTPARFLSLFEEPSMGRALRPWMLLGIATLVTSAIVLVVPAVLIDGEFGLIGLAAWLTMFGAAALEGYGHNAAALTRTNLEQSAAGLRDLLAAVDRPLSECARLAGEVVTALSAARTQATAAGLTVAEIAAVSRQQPEIFGYNDSKVLVESEYVDDADLADLRSMLLQLDELQQGAAWPPPVSRVDEKESTTTTTPLRMTAPRKHEAHSLNGEPT